ncbi:unnamed protein product [Scytosiphon promiscuus]
MVSEIFAAGWAYIRRRTSILLLGLMYTTFNVPKQMWGSVAARRDGVGYFADPLGKPPLLTYWKTLLESSYTALLLWSKAPTRDALLAAGGQTAAEIAATAESTEWLDDGVTVVDKGSYIAFTPPADSSNGDDGCVPDNSRPVVGVVILPGALVSPTAYAPLARSMAQRGHPSFIVRFDFDLATDGWERVGEIIPKSPSEAATAGVVATTAEAGEGVEGQAREMSGSCPAMMPTPTKWVLAGHSMGTMAIERFYPENPDSVHGVVYMGSGNRIGDAMAGAEVPALVLRGSRDPFCPEEGLKNSAHKLPKDAETVVIEGGNHRGFASYGWQPLDWEATISLEEQRRLVVEALSKFIESKVLAAD